MQVGRAVFVLLLISVAATFAQQPSKPEIGRVEILPSESVVPSGDCKSSTAGYLEQNQPTDGQIGEFVSKSLQHGYIVTVYPATKRGVFVNIVCTNTIPTTAR
jgi:hypothetical protein